ncbi:ribose ABC transporter permease [Halocella sp. SP3-1]|uniref:ABC transporter permease n=1 Tax=Halocella sp. SP3-1 TaxID=2382161 RepID=UPI00257130D6|nr:ribose ABC transporter permease [Halocella sp. SP3-1]
MSNIHVNNQIEEQKIDFKKLMLEKYGMILVLIAISLFFIILTKGLFLESRNLINILRQISINAIIATGMTFVIITAGIDLSVGSIVALAAVISTSIFHSGIALPVFLLIIIVVIVSMIIGSIAGGISGFSIVKFNVPPFISTLAMMTIARGLAFLYTNGRPVWGLPKEFNFLGRGYVLKSLIGEVFPVPVLIMIIIMIIANIVLQHTKFGRYVYAIGDNEEAARLSGIKIKKIKLLVYVINGMLAALAGILLASRLASGQPNAGQSYELNAIAAVVIGGTSLMGGEGTIKGTFIGALIMGVLNNGLNLVGVGSYMQQVILGMVILMAVLLDQLRKNVIK